MNKKDIETSKRKITLFSLIVTIVLVIIKIFVAYISNSIGVLSEALNNGLDLVTALIVFFSIRLAARPPDKDHTYGHGKYENLSALIELIVIFLLSSFIIYKSIQRIILRDFNLTLNIYIFIILIISIILNIIRVYFIGRATKRFNSFALKAEFLNYSSDIFSSIIVLGGLFLSRYGFQIADPIASIVVALFVLILTLKLSFKVIRDLMDYVPAEITEKINEVLIKNPDVKKIDRLKIHEVGNVKFINLDLCISENLYLTQVEKIKRNLKKEIKSKIPEAELIIEINSDFSEDNIAAMAKKVLSEFRDIYDVHNVLVCNIGGKIDLSVHIETSKKFNLEYIENFTKIAEDKIKKRVKNIRSVYIHSEDFKDHEDWHDITNKSKVMIERIKKEISEIIEPQTCHNFTILEKDNHFNIAFHCRLDKKINIKKAHNISNTIENLIKNKFKNTSEVIVHLEPN